ncbi:hypothetical protein [Streptomyces sp. NRRL S-350]|uniref:hypothetical protein n=1 Tax=Streptomyces sp. NRRL S-350 TaxID=1463902 RepID=UPI0004BEDD14|nr:hypothetical protein [Streptomyces sp. NRRL S-350]
MSDETVVRGSVERLRVAAVSIYEVRLEPDDATLRDLGNDPHGVFRRFFESQGHEVNGIAIAELTHLPGPGPWAHDNSPEENSHWYRLEL